MKRYIDLKNSKISSSFPQAYIVPTIEPALVPAIWDGRMFCSSKI
jgi:hypothetical protein